MSRPIVSVVMPAYNHERFVAAAMRSVMQQTLEEFEFLVADDCSTDGTADAIERFIHASGDSRIRFTRSDKNRGVCTVLNDLLDHCRGEYVALLNSDDAFEPHKLERQLAHIAANRDLAASFTWVRLVDEAGQPFTDARHSLTTLFDQQNRPREQWLRRLFNEGSCLCHPTMMARRKKFPMRFDCRLCRLPDLDMWVRLLMEQNIDVLPERLTRYRVRAEEANLCGQRPDTLSLIQLELPVVLDHFTRLNDADCRGVFGFTGSDAVRSYAAYAAALSGPPAARAWGMRGLYALLGAKKSRDELVAFGFDEKMLYEIGAQQDVYSLLPHRARLYYADAPFVRDAGPFLTDAFEESRSVALSASSFYMFSHRFILNGSVKALRFDPAEQPCRVRLTRAHCRLQDGSVVNLLPGASHNGADDSGWVTFETFDPSYFFVLDEPAAAESFEVAGDWAFLNPADLLHRYAAS